MIQNQEIPCLSVLTSVGPNGVSRVERDGAAKAAISLDSLDGVELAYPSQVRLPPEDMNAGGDPLSVGRSRTS